MYGECRYERELLVYEVIKNCPRYWKVALNVPTNVSSASPLGAQ